jgi:hypothetical protein
LRAVTRRQLTTLCKQKVVENHYGCVQNVVRKQFLGQRSGQRRRGEPRERQNVRTAAEREEREERRQRRQLPTVCTKCERSVSIEAGEPRGGGKILFRRLRTGGTGGKATTATTSDGLHEMGNAIRSVSIEAGEPRGGGKNTRPATQNVRNGRKGNDCDNF